MLHIVPEGAAFGECALRSFEPRRFRNSVRAVIARTGRLNGLLIGGVDLDFDATTRLLQPHIHAIIAGDRGGLTDAIRKSYQRRSRASPSVPRRVYRQVLVKEIGPTVEDRASAVTYTAKGYIREIRSYTGEKGRPRRSRPFRLSEPLHAEELLWRAHLSAAEFRLHMGVPRGPARSLRTACETACR
ncbi:hypothetical protein GXW71_06345 [Roseomonas hellenica]|uniref:Transposase n=1 Tax=Plastoroseomonas hellenica TaxID=2687306 RepID=A0ABS5EUK7_9PROT|nr:hypothetical protein [Plastoroseomonas hellenica]MBR0663974.1 hypothetical protein [Plastoroseomonas hellenica]